MLHDLGADLEGEAGELGRASYQLFRGFCQELPCLSPGVRSIVSQRARAATLAAFYGRRGAQLGIHTPQGAEALQRAATWDARAERLAVTSLDVSTRLAKAARAKPIDVHAEVARAFGGNR